MSRASPQSNFDRRALAGDLAFGYALPRLGAGLLYGEVVWAVNLDRALFASDPVATGRDARQLGAMVAIRRRSRRIPRSACATTATIPTASTSERRGIRVIPYDATFSTIGTAVAWCTLPYLRVTLQYDHRTNPLGRNTRGAPTTLAADSLILRGQLEL